MSIITAPNFPEIRIDEDTLNLRIDSLEDIPIDFVPRVGSPTSMRTGGSLLARASMQSGNNISVRSASAPFSLRVTAR